MAVILDGAGDSYLVADHASLDVPGDDDWFVMFWCRPTNLAAGETGDLQQFYNHGTFGSGNFLHINCNEDGNANPNIVSGGTNNGSAQVTWPGGDGDDGRNYLVCVTYDSANDLIWMKVVPQDEPTTVISANGSLTVGEAPSGDLALGRRIQDHTREFHGWIGEFMKGRGLFITDANLLDAANNNGLNLTGATIDFYYEFETSQATEPNADGAVGDATREGDPTTGTPHFYKLVQTGGGIVLPGPTYMGMGMGMG